MIHIRTPLFFFWLSLPEAMASAVVLPLLIFLMVGATVVVAKPHGSSNKLMIRLGSSLSPTIKPTSWLSPSGLFGFGFYQQGDGFAVGIWLLGHPHNIVVWTAERDDPPVSSNATLVLTKDGMLLLRNDGRANGGKPIVDLPEHAVSASMLDSGNFVIYGRSSDFEAIWESFSYPTDSILGGQNLTGDLLSSASESDRSSGRFILTVQVDGNIVSYPAYSNRSPSDAYWATGDFSAAQLSLTQTGVLYATQILANISYSISENERVVYRATLEANGMLKLYTHIFSPQNRRSVVRLRWSRPDHQCDVRGFCGFNSFCSSSREADDANITTGGSCSCYPGFAYISPNETSQGCYRNFSDMVDYCKERAELFRAEVMTNNSWGGVAYSTFPIVEDQDCRKSCLEDCYCAAALSKKKTCYKYKLPIMYGLGNQSTATWAFIKVSSRIPLPHNGSNGSPPIGGDGIIVDGKKTLIVVLAVSLGSILLLSSLVSVCVLVAYYCRGYRKLSAESLALTEDFSIRVFSYVEIEKATCGFNEELGRGSSGAVYRGSLCDGRTTVAVKKLARVTREGDRDFRSEMMAIGRTHHKNLVRLIGFCVDGSRKFLVYEYMSNGSLADLLFKADRRPVWKERKRMAVDVARGILYLHEECEVCVIHCDIKAENILIDDSLTAKISDFGLAKLLLPNESGIAEGIKETRGLAPEWRKSVVVSVKADVYSYGVLLLEVVCCRRNMEVNVSSPDEVIISTWAYQCFVDGQLEKLVGDEEVEMQILERMVKVALLCIQEDPDRRPSMKNVILMLEGTMNIPLPPSPFP